MEDNMKSVKWTLVITALLLVLAACSSNMTGEQEVSYPQWWNTQDDANYICSYGISTDRASQTSSMDAAKANALAESARFVETEVKAMLKNFEEESGVKDPQVLKLTENVVKVTSSATFSGVLPGSVMTRKTVTKGETRYTTYAQMKVPKVEVNRNLIENVRNEEALYNQFKASQAFQELEGEFTE